MAAAPSSVAAAVAAAKAAVADRLKQSQVEVVLEALTTDADVDALCLEKMAGLEEASACISADDCKACGEPIYVFPPDLWGLPGLCASVDSMEPVFVTPSNKLIPAVQPPPGLESPLAWHSDNMAVGFGGSGSAATGSSADHGSARPQRRRRRRCQLVLATHLKEMEEEDASCIVHVRQIHRLGFRSPELLREYCSRVGPVKRVAVSNAHEKLEDVPAPPFPVRVRPSGIGFVVMERPEDAAAVVALGEIQTIHGCQIRVRKFEAREDKGFLESEDTSVQTTRSPSLAASLADENLSELSFDADDRKGKLYSEGTAFSTLFPPSSTNSTADEIMSEASFSTCHDEGHRTN